MKETVDDTVGLLALNLSYGFTWTIEEMRACKEVGVLFKSVPEYFAFFNVSPRLRDLCALGDCTPFITSLDA